MSKRKPVLPTYHWILHNAERLNVLDAEAELRAAEAVIRAAKGVCVSDGKGGWEWIGGDQFNRLCRAIARLDKVTGRAKR